MTARLRLILPYPPSANTYWKPSRGRGLVPSDEARAYKALVKALQQNSAKPLLGDVVLSARFYRPRRAGDLGNRLKVLEDALIGVAYLDDAQISRYREVVRDDSEPGDPRAVVELEGESFATPEQVAEAAEKKRTASQKRRRSVNANRARRACRASPAVYR